MYTLCLSNSRYQKFCVHIGGVAELAGMSSKTEQLGAGYTRASGKLTQLSFIHAAHDGCTVSSGTHLRAR